MPMRGITKDDEVAKKIFVLDAGQWKDYSEMPTARCFATAVGYHTMLIVVGGAIEFEGKQIRVSTTELLNYWILPMDLGILVITFHHLINS